MTHDDRVRHSWQKYDDRTASQSRPPMGRQFINCTSFILLLVLSILPLPLSHSLSFRSRDLLRRPIRRKEELRHVHWNLCLSGMAQFAPFRLRSRAENLLLLLVAVSQCTSGVTKRFHEPGLTAVSPLEVLLETDRAHLIMGFVTRSIARACPMLNVCRESCQEKGSRNRFVEGIYICIERERVVLNHHFSKDPSFFFLEKIFRKRKDNNI